MKKNPVLIPALPYQSHADHYMHKSTRSQHEPKKEHQNTAEPHQSYENRNKVTTFAYQEVSY